MFLSPEGFNVALKGKSMTVQCKVANLSIGVMKNAYVSAAVYCAEGEVMAFKKSRQHGMTLLELMIVLAIIGILATIAIPSFNDQVMKSRRAEARNALFDGQLKQAEYFANNLTYGWRGQIGTDEFTANNYYRITVWKPDGEDFTTGFEMRATPVSGEGQENDTLCSGSSSPLYFCVDETGVISTGDCAPQSCW
jgi:type IV pilus assembly protein PilE